MSQNGEIVRGGATLEEEEKVRLGLILTKKRQAFLATR